MKSCRFWLVVISLLALASGQLQTTFCILDCLPVDQSTISYCAGLLPYTSCISQRDLTTQNADIRAYNNSVSFPAVSDSCACREAKRQLLCSLMFPKCALAPPATPISQPVCRNTCVQTFARCNMTFTSSVCALTEGTGPGSNYTGNPTAAVSSCPLTRMPFTATDVRLTLTFQTNLTDVVLLFLESSLQAESRPSFTLMHLCQHHRTTTTAVWRLSVSKETQLAKLPISLPTLLGASPTISVPLTPPFLWFMIQPPIPTLPPLLQHSH